MLTAKLAADQEVSVKNGAELLDRLIKDIVAEKASNYVSTAHSRRNSGDEQPVDNPPAYQPPTNNDGVYDEDGEPAFSLPRFIPLLAERIYTLNPFTRMFLVNWISLLDSIPDLELISHLPAFLKGLIQFLSDANEDVRTATQQSLTGFLEDIRRSTDVKKMLKERKGLNQALEESDSASGHSRNLPEPAGVDGGISSIANLSLNERLPEDNFEETDDWVPGQDLHIDYSAIIEILIPFLSDTGFLYHP
jgi:vacuole morphology and inheritance protein 14